MTEFIDGLEKMVKEYEYVFYKRFKLLVLIVTGMICGIILYVSLPKGLSGGMLVLSFSLLSVSLFLVYWMDELELRCFSNVSDIGCKMNLKTYLNYMYLIMIVFLVFGYSGLILHMMFRQLLNIL